MSTPDDGMVGCALTNEQVAASVARERATIARAEDRIARSLDLLRARAGGQARGWSRPASGFRPAKPEDPAVAEAVLADLEAGQS
jgi:hypothetical protein